MTWRAGLAVAAIALAAPASAPAASVFLLHPPDGAFSPGVAAPGLHGTTWFASDAPLNEAGSHPRYAVARVDLGGRFKLFFTRAETNGIAVSRTGTVFATERLANRLAVVSPAGHVSEVPVPSQEADPGSITAGPDGNGWFVEQHGNRIGRVTPAGAVTEFDVPDVYDPAIGQPFDATPEAITTASDGRMWLTVRNGIATVATDGTIATHSWHFDLPAFPIEVAPAPDGTVWTAEREQEQLEHVDAAGEPAAVPGPAGSALAVAPDGTLSAFDPGDASRLVVRPDGSTRRQHLSVLDAPGDRETIRATSSHAAAPGPAGTIWLSADLTDSGGGEIGGVAVLDDSGRCIVPALRFDDLKAAKLALANHSCRLGKVRRRSPHHLPAKDLRVKAQGVKAGKLRPHGARIAITLAE